MIQSGQLRYTARQIGCGLLMASLIVDPAFAWSNRGHRMVNLAAATELPAGMPGFLKTAAAVQEISYLGPEPDRWRPKTEPELSATSSTDHHFFLELGDKVAPLPRRRYEYLRKLTAYRIQHAKTGYEFTAAGVGTLPWQVLEMYERLKSSFRSYRSLTGGLPKSVLEDIEPMTTKDLQDVEQTCLFYAGLLGHYIGDGAQPLHTTINTNGWKTKDNPHEFTRKPGIHRDFEIEADREIAAHAVTLRRVQESMANVRYLSDVFADTISYLRTSNRRVPTVYELKKRGQLHAGSLAFQRFTTRRLAGGASMLRDVIYTAWTDSKDVRKPRH